MSAKISEWQYNNSVNYFHLQIKSYRINNVFIKVVEFKIFVM